MAVAADTAKQRRRAVAEQFTEIGLTALRDPATGEYLPAIPLFVRTEDLGDKGPSGLPSAEEKALKDVGAIFAANMKRYIDGGGLAETNRRAVLPMPENRREKEHTQ